MARIRGNNVFGTTSNNPLAAAGTGLTSSGLVNLPAVAGSDRAVITLDPNRVHGAPEIVYVTAHTAGNGSATILRGQEGTAAREHPAGTFWVHASTAAEVERVYDPPMCSVTNSALQSIANAAWQVVTFNTEQFDTDGMWAAGTPTRITFTTAGVYQVSIGAEYLANATGVRGLGLRKNGVGTLPTNSYVLVPNAGGGVGTALSLPIAFKAAAGDYLEMLAFQNSGGALNLGSPAYLMPHFSATYLGSGD